MLSNKLIKVYDKTLALYEGETMATTLDGNIKCAINSIKNNKHNVTTFYLHGWWVWWL